MELTFSLNPTNQEIADWFEVVADALTVLGSDRFRIQSYQVAAETIRHLDEELITKLEKHEDLTKLPGIGKTIAAKLNELYITGTIKSFQEYVAGMPAGMQVLTKIPGIGGKRAYQLSMALHLVSADSALKNLQDAVAAGRVRQLEGWGEKSEKELILAIERYQKEHLRIPLSEALPVAKKLLAHLKKSPAVIQAEALGSLRRQQPSVGDIDLGVATTDMGRVETHVKTFPLLKRVLVMGDQQIRILLTNDWQVDIKSVPPAEWGAFIQHFTGSKQHNILLRSYALQRGLSLSEHGIKDTATGELKTYDSEQEFYAALGLKHIPPAERQGGDELQRYQL